MNYYNEDTIIYLNGDFVKASESKMDFYSQSLHYGYAVFEGIRSYRTVTGDARIFEEKAHYERLKRSATLMNMPYEYSTEKLIEATYTLLDLNNIKDAYIRPLIYAPANMSFVRNTVSYIMIAAWEMAPFLGEKLLRVMTSSFQRPNPKSCHIEAKASGHYVNSLLASHEAKANGYDEALLTDMNGFVAEAPGANMFMEIDGVLYTPPAGNILPGITRATVMGICDDLNIPVEEKLFTIDELRNADAAFFCGTAAEVIGWDSLDGRPFLKSWNESAGKIVQDAYKNKVIESGFTRSRNSREGVTA
ncbi:MAG: branched-chain-amino-acid transaminase [Chitinophagaceae bacterium]